MTNWKKQKLGEVIDKIVGGGTPTKNNPAYWGGSIPWASVKDMENGKYYLNSTQDSITEEGLENSASNFIGAGTIVMPTRMGLGRVVQTNIGTAINQDLKAIYPKENINNDFLKWSLVNSGQKFTSLASGSTVSGIRLEDVKNLEISLPTSLEEQVRIAGVISTYENLIINNEKRIKILEEMAERLYTEWFVKFRFPSHEKVKIVDSPLGKIPEDWEVKRIDEVARVIRGTSYSTEQISDYEGDFYLVNLKSFNRGGGFRFDGVKYFNGSVKENQLLKQGDIVVAVTDMTTDRAVISRPARIPNIKTAKVTFSADVVKIVPEKLPVAYAYYSLLDYRFTETTKNKANGANVLHLKPQAISEYKIILPTNDLLEKFGNAFENTVRLTDKLSEENAKLTKMRDLLIPQLVTGRRELR